MWQNEWQPWENADIYGPAHHSLSTSSWRRRPSLMPVGYMHQTESHNMPPYARTFSSQPSLRNMPPPPMGHDWRSFDGWGNLFSCFKIFF